MDSNGLYTFKEVKDFFEISKEKITLYIFHFTDYFSLQCQPVSGKERFFTIDDIMKLNFIHYYWEQDPDIESIGSGLNQEEYLEYPFNNVYYELTPIIRDDFENIDAESDNYIFFNRSIYDSSWELAKEYLSAAKTLLSDAKNRNEPWKKVFPILFNLRHGIELYLKSVIDLEMTKTHDLKIIFEQLKKESNLNFGRQFTNLVLTLDSYDKSTTFRYQNPKSPYDEKVIDIELTFKLIKHFEELIEHYRNIKNIDVTNTELDTHEITIIIDSLNSRIKSLPENDESSIKTQDALKSFVNEGYIVKQNYRPWVIGCINEFKVSPFPELFKITDYDAIMSNIEHMERMKAMDIVLMTINKLQRKSEKPLDLFHEKYSKLSSLGKIEKILFSETNNGKLYKIGILFSNGKGLKYDNQILPFEKIIVEKIVINEYESQILPDQFLGKLDAKSKSEDLGPFLLQVQSLILKFS